MIGMYGLSEVLEEPEEKGSSSSWFFLVSSGGPLIEPFLLLISGRESVYLYDDLL